VSLYKPSEKDKRLFQKSHYSLLAARNDVSLKEPNEIVKELNEKYQSANQVYEFFEKRFLRGDNYFKWHLSPLGLVWIAGEDFNNKFKGQGMYSLRHVVENLVENYGTQRAKEILKEEMSSVPLVKIPSFEVIPIENNLYWDLRDEKIKQQKIYIQEEPDGLGFYVIWDGVSRVATHQLVRHQSFDFQQQSQRYINYGKKKAGGFYIPPSLITDFKNISRLENYLSKMKETYKKYQKLIEEDMPNEEARYLLPNSFTSRIFIFMPKERCCGRDGIKEFIEKRKVPEAQEEIRNFALTLEEIIKNY